MRLSSWCRAGYLAAGVLMAVSLSGCDYWPPALQAQIEQLKMDVQSVTAEKAQLQNQVAEATRAKEELEARVEELTRVNRERAGAIAGLENRLAAEQQKVAKLTRAGSAKSAAKAPAKAPAKPAAKKKPAKTTKGKRA